MGWDEIKTFQMRGITLNIIQLCGRKKPEQGFPVPKLILSILRCLTLPLLPLPFSLLVKFLTFSVSLGCG